MLQLQINNKFFILLGLAVSIYSVKFLFINNNIALNHYTSINPFINLDVTSVSDFEDSFALLSDSLIFLEQDGVFVFDYYTGFLYAKKDLKCENSEESREVFFLKLDPEHHDYAAALKQGG